MGVMGTTGCASATPTPTPSPSPSCTPGVAPWATVANHPLSMESPAIASNGTFLYSMGGYSGGATAASYSYDPVANTWTPIASMPAAIYDAHAAYAANVNAIYVFGGYDGANALGSTYRYDVTTGTWSTVAPMPAARIFPGVAYYGGNGKIYVIGGFDSGFTPFANTWEYDPVVNTWNTSLANMPTGLGGSGTSIDGQFIYMTAGYDGAFSTSNFRYDIVSNTWTTMAPAPVAPRLS